MSLNLLVYLSPFSVPSFFSTFISTGFTLPDWSIGVAVFKVWVPPTCCVEEGLPLAALEDSNGRLGWAFFSMAFWSALIPVVELPLAAFMDSNGRLD